MIARAGDLAVVRLGYCVAFEVQEEDGAEWVVDVSRKKLVVMP